MKTANLRRRSNSTELLVRLGIAGAAALAGVAMARRLRSRVRSFPEGPRTAKRLRG